MLNVFLHSVAYCPAPAPSLKGCMTLELPRHSGHSMEGNEPFLMGCLVGMCQSSNLSKDYGGAWRSGRILVLCLPGSPTPGSLCVK